MVTCFVLATIFRVPLYKMLVFDRGALKQLFTSKPINCLILYGAVWEHLGYLMTTVIGAMILVRDSGDSDPGMLGSTPCAFFYMASLTTAGIRTLTGFAVSLYRILYLRHEMVVRYVVGELRMMWTLLVFVAVVHPALIYLFSVEEDSDRHLFNMCMGISSFESQTLISYRQGQHRAEGDHVVEAPSTGIAFRALAIFVLLVLVAGEILMTTMFFYQIVKHDNGKAISLVAKEAIRKRNKENVVTFTGQIISTLFQLTVVIFALLMIGSMKKNQLVRQLFGLLRSCLFTFVAIADILLSPPLRRSLVTIYHRD